MAITWYLTEGWMEALSEECWACDLAFLCLNTLMIQLIKEVHNTIFRANYLPLFSWNGCNLCNLLFNLVQCSSWIFWCTDKCTWAVAKPNNDEPTQNPHESTWSIYWQWMAENGKLKIIEATFRNMRNLI